MKNTDKLSPGTAGVVQRITVRRQSKSKKLKVLKQVRAVGCSQNEY